MIWLHKSTVGAAERPVPSPQFPWQALPDARAIAPAEPRPQHRGGVSPATNPEHPFMGPQPTD